MTYLHNTVRNDFPPFRFLAYYQILEYYYIECFTEFLKEKTDVNKMEYYEIIKLIEFANTYKAEDKMLELVLRKYIQLQDFKYFAKKEKIPCNKITDNLTLSGICINNENDFYKSLSKRIYTLRNAIVHSKVKTKNKNLLLFTRTNKRIYYALNIEIRLIKYIAESVINANLKKY